MDSQLNHLSNPRLEFDLNDTAAPNQYPCSPRCCHSFDLNLTDPASPDHPADPPPPPSVSRPPVDFSIDDRDFSATVSEYINDMLMADEAEPDSRSALPAAGKSLSLALAGRDPLLPGGTHQQISDHHGCRGWKSGKKPSEPVGRRIGETPVDRGDPSSPSSFLSLSFAPSQSFCRTPRRHSNPDGTVGDDSSVSAGFCPGDSISVLRFCGKVERGICSLDESPDRSEKRGPLKENAAATPLKFHAGCGGGRRQQTKEAVDLRALLLLCARAVSVDDRAAADDLLRQIMRHSSPFGDGCERFAHYFAGGLTARMAGTGGQNCAVSNPPSSKHFPADLLQAYRACLLSCPFARFAIHFANHQILRLVEEAEAEALHIIDFGILYGLQWPAVIKRLSRRRGGPPRLRITGIEFPQAGLRPEKMAGVGLARCCERFNVPFEYHSIAQSWESIRISDLGIGGGEKVAVNCLFRLKNLLDETVAAGNPRDTVLRLIRGINPDVFVHAVANGSYNAPFFITRFREAAFHFSSLYDMFDAVLAREDVGRMTMEREVLGREAMNVIACEDSERVERPETYKQWHGRHRKAGFRQVPLDRELLRWVRAAVRRGYHKDFVVEENEQWMVQGWRGRSYYASSCWVPGSDP